jgi:hypothetical protein
LARGILNRARAAALGIGLCALSCKHDHPAPAPAPAPLDSATQNARQLRFDGEIERAQTRWRTLPDLRKCPEIMHEAADLELCHAATSALTAVEALAAAAPPATVLPALGNAALALTRLFERARYLSLEELGRRSLEGDAGLPPPGSASARGASPAPVASGDAAKAQRAGRGLFREHPTLKLAQSPLSHLVADTAHLEHDTLRNFAAYLEYAPLAVRQSAFLAAKELQAEHAEWPLLTHLLREAAVIETDSALKQNLSDLADLGLPRGKRPDQPTGSK